MKKRLLLITYFFPPFNLTESRRALVIARAAVDSGWHVDVIAPWAPSFHSSGEFHNWMHYFSDPDKVRVYRIREGRLARVRKALERLFSHVHGGWHLALLMRFPDACMPWLFFLLPRALWLSARHRPNVVLTSSFPYTVHIAGLIVSKLFHIPWIVDTRDGWAVDDSEQFFMSQPSARLRKWHGSLMSIVMKRANQVWSLTSDIRDATASLFRDQDSNKFVAVVAGYDLDFAREHARSSERNRTATDATEFVLGYAGSFRPDLTPAEPIVGALNVLRERSPEIYSKVKLCVWGYTSRTAYHNYLLRSVSKYHIEDRLEHHRSLPEKELISLLSSCDALLITNGSLEWTKKRLTTKLFVYLAVQRPILAICEPGSAISRLVQEANVGLAVSPSDPMQIAEVIEKWVWTRKKNGAIPFQPDLRILEQYSLQKGVMPLIGKCLRRAYLRLGGSNGIK